MSKGQNMKEYKNLLVVVDATSNSQPALARAIELATRNQASITVFLTIFDFSYEMTSILSGQERESMRKGVIAQRQAWLDDVLEQYTCPEISIQSEVIWHNRPFESIIQHAISGNFDLII